MLQIPETPPLTNEEILTLSERARQGDLDAYGIVLEKFSYVIELTKRKLSRLNVDQGAIRFGAIMGIRAALRKYTKDKGDFSPYAYVCALQTAKREISKREYLIHVPNAKLNVFLKDKEAPYELIRIDGQTGDEGEKPIGDAWMNQLKQTEIDAVTQEISLEELDLEQFWTLCQQVLEEPEKDAIALTYGLSTTPRETYLKKYGKTYEWFRIQKTKGLEKLRTHFSQEGIKAVDFAK